MAPRGHDGVHPPFRCRRRGACGHRQRDPAVAGRVRPERRIGIVGARRLRAAASGHHDQFFLSTVPEGGPASAPVAFGALLTDLNGGPYLTPAHGDFFVAWSDGVTSAFVQVASRAGTPRSPVFTTVNNQPTNGQFAVETPDGILYLYNVLGMGFGYDNYAIPFRCR